MRRIGQISEKVVQLLGVEARQVGTAIFVGQTNIDHMKNEHPNDYATYGEKISEIIESPDYVGINPRDDSLEYIKLYADSVKVAVRISTNGKYFVRSLYVINSTKLNNYLKSGRLKRY
ncbi:MAG: transposase [Clostridia bacterium]|nr:transposase [Clostridia bacterium]